MKKDQKKRRNGCAILEADTKELRMTKQGKKWPAAARNWNAPFPFPLRGKPGREGSPHAAQDAAPPTRGLPPPCESPAKKSARYLTGEGLLMEAVLVRKRPEV